MALRQRRELGLGLFEGVWVIKESCANWAVQCHTLVTPLSSAGTAPPWIFLGFCPSFCLQMGPNLLKLFGEAGIDLPKAKVSSQPPPLQGGILG